MKYLDFVGGGLGFNVVEGSCITALEPMAEKDRRKMAEALTRHAKRFHRQLMKPTHPAPSILQLMAFRMSRTSMKLTLSEDNRDYTHYRDHGWFDSDYYYPVRVGPLKRVVGATFDWMTACRFKQTEDR